MVSKLDSQTFKSEFQFIWLPLSYNFVLHLKKKKRLCKLYTSRCACGVIVTIVGNGHGEKSSNPGQGCLYFHTAIIPLGKV